MADTTAKRPFAQAEAGAPPFSVLAQRCPLRYHAGVEGIYLDWAATALPYPDILEDSCHVALSAFGNPSARHGPGRAAREVLEASRARCAAALGVAPETLVFTSGGTESNHIVLASLLNRLSAAPQSRERAQLLLSGLEHASIHQGALGLARQGLKTAYLKTDACGALDREALSRALDADPSMLALSAVNNETGFMEDIADIVALLRARSRGRRIHIHVDAVQAAGKHPFFPARLGIDSASFSAHKFGGPRGCGILYLAKNIDVFFQGGGQEGGMRSGTENPAGAHATSLALERRLKTMDENLAHGRELEVLLQEGLLSLGARILPEGRLSQPDAFSPWILQAALPGIPGEVLVRALSDQGCALSTGSACSAKTKGRRVLEALGIEAGLAASAFRVSSGASTSPDEIRAFLDILKSTAARLRVG